MPTETPNASAAAATDVAVAKPAAITRRVVLLPDARFFVRSVPVAGAATAEDVAAQVELALETLSPFPVPQLYHGHLWKPGSGHALVYAAYRRRFTAEETETWVDADLVIPAFVSCIGLAASAAETVILPSADGFTAVHWPEPGSVPGKVLTASVSDEADEAERERVKLALIKQVGGSRTLIELTAPPEQVASEDDDQFAFQLGDRTTELPATQTEAMDVRDKAELAGRRRARQRDLLLWRGFIGLIIGLFVLGFVELALVAVKVTERQRAARLAQQQPTVDQIMTAHSLSARIEELSTKRLRPFEMIGVASSARPGSIQFLTTTTSGLYTLDVQAQTTSPADVDTYTSNLRTHAAVSGVEVPETRTRDGLTTFRVVITFRPEGLVPATATATPTPAARPVATPSN